MNKPQLYEEYKKINRLLSTAQERQRMLELFNNIQGTENTRMRNEIKELKEKIEYNMNKGQKMGQEAGLTLLQMNEKLKEEMEKYKKESEDGVKVMDIASRKYNDKISDLEEYIEKREEDMEKLEVENEKLKEEIEELNKKKSIKWSREYAMPLITQLKEENEKLKEKIESMKCSWGGDK